LFAWRVLFDLDVNAATISWRQPEALWNRIPDASLAVLPGCAHNAHMEKPDMFNMIVHDFLRDSA
jgi:pimeloyl-ACP methyl ester carboxylesterase